MIIFINISFLSLLLFVDFLEYFPLLFALFSHIILGKKTTNLFVNLNKFGKYPTDFYHFRKFVKFSSLR